AAPAVLSGAEPATVAPAAASAPSASAVSSLAVPVASSPPVITANPVLPASTDLAEERAEPPLFDEHGKPLDQTDARPVLTSPSFQKRIAAVARAIVSGEVEPALAAFFPLVAYQQVKDVAKP